MLNLWNAPNSVSLYGLFHGAYSDLSIPLFNHELDRKMVSDLIRTKAEKFLSVFCNTPQHLIILMMNFESGENAWKTLFSTHGKLGLWMNFVSRMGAIYNLMVAEENEFGKKETDELKARYLYWEAVCRKECDECAEALLLKACAHNSFIGEPHLVLAQIYLSKEKFWEAESGIEIGLKILLEWGMSWDKRLPWEAWISWGCLFRISLGNELGQTISMAGLDIMGMSFQDKFFGGSFLEITKDDYLK
ncbi:hypothetical protein SUGI_1010960 [Cryptomeria japonica]|nr:hypothetical protein SUGI_1010960 [Cryptomeria japonica]